MFNLFKEKCPVCKMELEKEKNYPEESGKKFCSENCKEDYKKQSTQEQSHHSGDGCCH
jgi:YHS domain-containing protein